MFSIIVCSHRPERAKFIQAHYETLLQRHDHEFILIDDARSLCEGYARGFTRSVGDLLIFSHDDVEFITADFGDRVLQHLSRFDVVGIGGTTKLVNGAWTTAGDPYCFLVIAYPESGGRFSIRYAGQGPICVTGIRALDGCFLACRREVAATVGFDAITFDGFHLYDLDFTFRAHLHGWRLAVCRDILLIHSSLGNPGNEWQAYRERFELKHRDWLASGERGHMRVVGTFASRDQLVQLSDPETLLKSIRWN